MRVTVKAKYSKEWIKVLQNVKTMGGVQGVRVGIVEKSTNSQTGENIAFYAACNEFGTKDIPARPFMRMTAEKHSQEWARLFARITNNQLIRDPKVAARAFYAIGTTAAADMKEMILSNMPPPNSPMYAEWKAHKPGAEHGAYAGTLVYTGQMLQTINYRLCTAAELRD